MKRVLFIIESLNGGGAEKVLLEIFKHINHSKYSVDLLLLVKEGIYLNELPEKVNVYSIFKNRLYFRIVKKISNIIQTNKLYKYFIIKSLAGIYDVEVSFLEGPSLKIHSNIHSDAYKITWVHCNLNIQRWWIKSFHSHKDAEEAYSQMDKIVFVSKDALHQFNRIFNVPRVSKQVHYNPINKEDIISKSVAYNVKKERFTICTIGTLGPQKAYYRLLAVASLLKEDKFDFEIWIIGTGNMKNQLKTLAEELGVSENVKFLGFMRNPFPYLNAADVFVSTSRTEGFPLVIAEAVCLGKAIIATAVTGTEEILDYGKYGELTSHETHDIYEAVKMLMLDDDLRKQYEIKSAERASMFDLNKSMRVIETILDQEI